MIKILNYRPMNKGYLVGYLDIEIDTWKLELRDLTVWEKDGRSWVNMPSKQYTKDNGSKGFSEVARFIDNDYKENFRKAVLEALSIYNHERGEHDCTGNGAGF